MSYQTAFTRQAISSKIQFFRAEVAADFDIAATSIYFKRLPRRVFEWNILNNVLQTQKIGLVASTWRSLYVSHALKRVFQDFLPPDTHTYVNLKMGVSRKQSTPNFPKNEHFSSPIPSRHGCISDASRRRLIQRLRDISKRADLQISETSPVRCIKGEMY